MRRAITRTVSFGGGARLYLGANVARIEARKTFEELVAKSPVWEIEEAGAVRLRSGNAPGRAALPVRCPSASRDGEPATAG